MIYPVGLYCIGGIIIQRGIQMLSVVGSLQCRGSQLNIENLLNLEQSPLNLEPTDQKSIGKKNA